MTRQQGEDNEMLHRSLGSSRISPTAHYTSYVWVRNGLSHKAFSTWQGRVLYNMLRPANTVHQWAATHPNLEMLLLARHHLIDERLDHWILHKGVRQIFEIAAGLSARGWRMTKRYPELLYVEGDLPEMSQYKHDLLAQHGLGSPHLQNTTLDALQEQGPYAMTEVAQQVLRPDAPVAVVTEGLMTYFPIEQVQEMWCRIASMMRAQGGGVYLCSFQIRSEARHSMEAQAFQQILSMFVKGGVYFHFESEEEAVIALERAGFDRAVVHTPPSGLQLRPYLQRGHMVRIIEAIVEPGE